MRPTQILILTVGLFGMTHGMSVRGRLQKGLSRYGPIYLKDASKSSKLQIDVGLMRGEDALVVEV